MGKKLFVCPAGSLPEFQVENGCFLSAVGNHSIIPTHTSASKPTTHSFEPAQFVSGEKVCRTFIFLQFMCSAKAMFSKP